MQCILNVLVFKCLAPQQEKESEWKKEDSAPLNPQPMGGCSSGGQLLYLCLHNQKQQSVISTQIPNI